MANKKGANKSTEVVAMITSMKAGHQKSYHNFTQFHYKGAKAGFRPKRKY